MLCSCRALRDGLRQLMRWCRASHASASLEPSQILFGLGMSGAAWPGGRRDHGARCAVLRHLLGQPGAHPRRAPAPGHARVVPAGACAAVAPAAPVCYARGQSGPAVAAVLVERVRWPTPRAHVFLSPAGAVHVPQGSARLHAVLEWAEVMVCTQHLQHYRRDARNSAVLAHLSQGAPSSAATASVV